VFHKPLKEAPRQYPDPHTQERRTAPKSSRPEYRQRQTLYYAFIFPNPDFRPPDEINAVLGGDQIRVRKTVLTNRVPDLHDARNIALYGSPNAHVPISP
jgi:hypothetical protein